MRTYQMAQTAYKRFSSSLSPSNFRTRVGITAYESAMKYRILKRGSGEVSCVRDDFGSVALSRTIVKVSLCHHIVPFWEYGR